MFQVSCRASASCDPRVRRRALCLFCTIIQSRRIASAPSPSQLSAFRPTVPSCALVSLFRSSFKLHVGKTARFPERLHPSFLPGDIKFPTSRGVIRLCAPAKNAGTIWTRGSLKRSAGALDSRNRSSVFQTLRFLRRVGIAAEVPPFPRSKKKR